jgi:hypothetical protein
VHTPARRVGQALDRARTLRARIGDVHAIPFAAPRLLESKAPAAQIAGRLAMAVM